MPRKKAVQSEAVVSPLADLAPAKVVRKRSSVKSSDAQSAPKESKTRTASTRKKAAVAADTTTVAAVTHRHKKQEVTVHHEEIQVPVAAAFEPDHNEVAKLAYSYYVARGYQPGDQTADWFRAVEELKQRHVASLLSDPR